MSASTDPTSIHFLAFVHGMWGSPNHLSVVENTVREEFSHAERDIELVTLRIQTNAQSHTYDGLDWGAERAVKEVYQVIAELEASGRKVTKFSIFGYSLGGLISRYAIGILYQRGFFRKVEPVNFTTFATPHLGLPRIPGFIGGMKHRLGPLLLSRTGKQFYGVDKDIWSPRDKNGKPLLEVMADEGSIFFKALKSFPNLTFYANAVNDLTVVYVTSMVEAYDPFVAIKTNSHRLGIKLDPKYKHVIESFGEISADGEVSPPSIETNSPDRHHSNRSLLPRFLQFPYRINPMLYLFVPILIPVGLTYLTIRFMRESRLSQRRIEMLAGSPDAESSLAVIMKKMEMAVADVVDPTDPGIASKDDIDDTEGETIVFEGLPQGTQEHSETGPNAHETLKLLPTAPTEAAEVDRQPGSNTIFTPPKSIPNDPHQPILSPAQLTMIESLNSIPHLRKVRAYFPHVQNAHSVIIVRDPNSFPVHEDGMGVVRHWVDRFVL